MENTRTRKRRRWGSVIVRKDADGNPTSFQARYVNPLDPSKKVGRNFGLEYETEAYRWLDEEHYLVTLHNKGIRQWVHPSQRGTDTMPTFREYAKDYFDKYRKPDGSKLSGRSNRCNEIVLRRLNKTFGDIPLDRITRQMVDEWYTTARDELTAWTFEQAARTLKRIMLAAATEQNDGTPPLIPATPCRYRVIKPQSKRRDQPPITADEIKRLADLFPDYYRLTLWLSLLVGGLRLGEVCALQLRDIDLENLQLHVRHSVNRGPDDRGKYRLCEPKTKSSKRVVPIPKPLAPLIEDHITRFCKDRKPDTMLFHSPMLDEWLLPPTTIERTFRMAREKIGRPRHHLPLVARHARHHARPRGRDHARDDGRPRTHQPHRRGGQLPANRQGTPPRHRGTPRLPVHAIERPDSDTHRHRPEGTPDRQAPQRGGQTQEDPAGKELTADTGRPESVETEIMKN